MDSNEMENGVPEEEKSERQLKKENTQKEKRKKSEKLSYLRDLVCWLSVVLCLFLFFFRIVIVSGPSMNKTLYQGDYVMLLNSTIYKNPKHGDIIVISKKSFRNGEPIIKRVIATQGQTVDIDFDLGKVYVDGVLQNEPYINTPTNLKEGVEFPLTVPEGCLFVMGDNRNSSKDSRDPEIGLIDKRQVIGKAILLLLPGKTPQTQKQEFDRIGVLS